MPDSWAHRWAAGFDTGAHRYNMTHVAAGSANGGEFGSSSGGAKKAPAKSTAKAGHPASAVTKARAAALRARAAADRAQAKKLGTQLHALKTEEAAAVAAADKAAAAAKAAGKDAKKAPETAKQAAARKAAATKAAATRKADGKVPLKQQITNLASKISTLNKQADQLDKQAAAL
jgi:hypothetical protein